jgi:PAS domain S-box-containing protein
LVHIGDTAVANLELDDLLAEVLTCIRLGMPCDAAGIALLDPDEPGGLLASAFDYPTRGGRLRDSRLNSHQSAASISRFIEVGEPRIFDARELELNDAAQGFRSLCQFPLISRNRGYGVLALASTQEQYFDETNLRFLRHVANQLAVVFENAIVRRQVDRLEGKAIVQRGSLERDFSSGARVEEIVGSSPVLLHALKRSDVDDPFECPDEELRQRFAQVKRELTPTNQELKNSEIDSRLIIDSIPGLVAVLTPRGEIELVSHQVLEYFGRSLDELRRWKTGNSVHPEDLPQVIELFTGSIASGSPYEIVQRFRRSDGVYRWFQNRGFPLRDPNGQIVRWCVLFADIDDQRRAEDAVRASERNLKLIIDTIPAVAWSARTDGSADFFSQHYLDYVGLSAEQVKDWGWTAAVHPDDLVGLAATWQGVIASGQAGDAEIRLRRFDGAYRWFLFRANPLRDESGKVVKWYGTNIDIEDRKRGEKALHAKEVSWRQIVDNIPGLVVTMTAGGEVEFLNRQTLEYFGKTNMELKNWALIDVVHPDDLPRVVEARARAIETGQIYDVEHRCRRADGVYRWFQVRGLPVQDAAGTITAWYLLLTDIDDRKKAEEALQSSERNLRLMINAIPTFIHVLRTDGSVLYVNQAVLDYTGLTLQDVQKEGYRARVFHPDDVERLREERQQALTRPVPFENEQRVLAKDGTYRWFLIRYNPLIDEQGRIDRWYCAAFDIEDRKRAEAQVEQAYLRLAEAQSVSKTGSFIADLLMDEHNWSEEAFRIFEFDPAAKVTVQMIRDTVHPDDLPSFDSVIARGMTGTDVDFVFRIVTLRGGVKHIRGMARVIEQIAGRPLFIGALQDVTASTVAEEALNQARSELAHVTRVTTLNALTASIAHEVNQPLSGIVSNGSACLRWLAADAPDLDEVREAVRDIVRDGKRAAEVIGRIRALVTKRTTPREKLDLNETIRDVLVIVGDEAKRKSVMIRTQFADEVLPIFGDRVQLQQVVLNLIMNGLDAMSSVSERARELVITTRNIDAGRVQVTVKDSGTGLDTNTIERIFDPFYTTKPSGMGMGLSISRSILQNHGGRLWAAPNDGPGTSFHFTLSTQQLRDSCSSDSAVQHCYVSRDRSSNELSKSKTRSRLSSPERRIDQ